MVSLVWCALVLTQGLSQARSLCRTNSRDKVQDQAASDLKNSKSSRASKGKAPEASKWQSEGPFYRLEVHLVAAASTYAVFTTIWLWTPCGLPVALTIVRIFVLNSKIIRLSYALNIIRLWSLHTHGLEQPAASRGLHFEQHATSRGLHLPDLKFHLALVIMGLQAIGSKTSFINWVGLAKVLIKCV